MPGALSVATYNVHGGIDGWGRPFDVVEACRRVDADVLVLQETWAPHEGPGLAQEVAEVLGYRMLERAMGPGRRYPVPARADRRWGPLLLTRRGVGIRADLHGSGSGERGSIGIALLWRVPAQEGRVHDLGRLPGDTVRRFALELTAQLDGASVVVTGTHMPHLRHGSPVQFRRLGKTLAPNDGAGVVMGDMNLWGPAVVALLPGWARTVRGASWPSWRPLFHIDHVLVRGPLVVRHAEVLDVAGSDHLPVRAFLSLC